MAQKKSITLDSRRLLIESLTRYAKLLCIHLLNLQKADAVFDELASRLYAMGSKQGMSLSVWKLTCSVLQRRDGTQFSVLRAWYHQ